MYYGRVLSSEEILYISRAQQRIITLTIALSREISDNDVNYANAQLIVELQYSIGVLKSTTLDWTADDRRMMMDYYTRIGHLVIFGFRSITFDPAFPINPDTIGVTVTEFNACCEAVLSEISWIKEELIRIETESIARDGEDGEPGTGSGNTEAEIIAAIDLGGVLLGTVYPIGTPLETIVRELLAEPPFIDALIYPDWEEIVEVGTTLSIESFAWQKTGTPENLILSDDAGVLTNQAVTGVSYVPPTAKSYPFTTQKDIIWTLDGSDTDPITLKTTSVYRSYYGKKTTANDTLITVTEADILASAVTVLAKTATSVTLTANTGNSEQGWVAVPKVQTGTAYTKWTVDASNSSDIVVGEFIQPPVDVTVNGVVYSVYRWGYRSPLTKPLTLHR